MIYFNNDYSEGCHQKVLDALIATNMVQTLGYGEDEYCAAAAAKIKDLCGREDVAVHFLVGGTQTNLTVIDAALRPHQGALCPVGGHINVHETGAVEATGHKVLTVPSDDGKITAEQVRQVVNAHRADSSFEHMVQPKLVYISNPTEYGTLYSLSELEALAAVCKELGLYLFLDGARLGYGLMAAGYNVTMADIARLTDVFYIGGTKVGALFGEAVVITNEDLKVDFRYLIKQHGGMLAKGRLLGVQFDALMTDNLYFDIAAHAVKLADQLRAAFDEMGVAYLVPGITNQVFPILSDRLLEELSKEFCFTEMERVSETHRAVRFCTSWATSQGNVDKLCNKLRELANLQ
ncbi:MAG: low specificity L-threonine aldolase [Oscillospiraceae bacterium]|nr:low specificity L-threonine aldolase [Oscillospiraceae bacterium]